MVLTDNCIQFEKRFLYKKCSNSIPAVLSSELLGYSKEIEIDAISVRIALAWLDERLLNG